MYNSHHNRNRSKKNALTTVHLVLLLSRTVLDSVGRLLLIFTWVTLFAGNFDPLLVTICYYFPFILLVFFNVLFNTSKKFWRADYIFGKFLFSFSFFLHLKLRQSL